MGFFKTFQKYLISIHYIITAKIQSENCSNEIIQKFWLMWLFPRPKSGIRQGPSVTIICPSPELIWVPTQGWLSTLRYLKSEIVDGHTIVGTQSSQLNTWADNCHNSSSEKYLLKIKYFLQKWFHPIVVWSLSKQGKNLLDMWNPLMKMKLFF